MKSRIGKDDLLHRLPQVMAILLVGILAGLLCIYAVKGFSSRYAQDDYCYGYMVRQLGFWKMQIQSYIQYHQYNSDRFSLTIMHSLVELSGGPSTVPILPALEIIGIVASLFFVVYQLQKAFHAPSAVLPAILAALTIVFFNFFLSAAQYQLLFWLSAMQTYLTPLVLANIFLGGLIWSARTGKFPLPAAAGLGLLSFFAGGFSESSGLWQLTCWGLILVAAFAFRRNNLLAMNAIRPALVLTGSAALAVIVMALCPANSTALHPFPHPDPLNLAKLILAYAWDFLRLELKGRPLPYSIVVLCGIFTGVLLNRNNSSGSSSTKHVLSIPAVLVVLYILTLVTAVPYTFARYNYPDDRSWVPAQYSLVIALFFIGWELAGTVLTLGRRMPAAWPVGLSLLGVVLCIYVVRLAPRVYSLLPEYQSRALAWDQRQALILQEKSQGIQDVMAPAFDSVYGITELHYESINWVNQCAAQYYGVRSISTADNYAGISTHPLGK